jgi:site-specific recombinase XerC
VRADEPPREVDTDSDHGRVDAAASPIRIALLTGELHARLAPRTALADWIKLTGLAPDDCLFPSRVRASPHLSTRQYARIVDSWVEEIGLDPAAYGTPFRAPHEAVFDSKNLRAVQLLLGHTKLENTVRYLGIEVEDALELAEQTEV